MSGPNGVRGCSARRPRSRTLPGPRYGAVTVFVAKSVAEALALVVERDFVFALLDVNRGNETNLADRQARGLGKRKVLFASASATKRC